MLARMDEPINEPTEAVGGGGTELPDGLQLGDPLEQPGEPIEQGQESEQSEGAEQSTEEDASQEIADTTEPDEEPTAEEPPGGELAADSGTELAPDEPPVITPPFEPPPFNPHNVDQTVRHGGSPGVRVRNLGLMQEPVRASSLPVLGGRVVPDDILAETQRLLTADTMEPGEARHAVLELLAPWLPTAAATHQ